MEPLKNIYSKNWILEFAANLKKIDSNISTEEYFNFLVSKPWRDLELKQRINKIADSIIYFLPDKPKDLFPKLITLVQILRERGIPDLNFPFIFLPEIISKVGLNDFKLSMVTLEKITVFTSGEFSIRYFYQSEFENTLKQMHLWSSHSHPFVRRLASEGSRPNLPWGIGIPRIKKNPEIHLPILENLWKDENEIVRRSVANHLNDISKLNPEITWEFCKGKIGHSENADRLVKHALRTLLKKGDKQVLSKYSYDTNWQPKKVKLDLPVNRIRIGENLEFNISISNLERESKKLRLEYKIIFRLAKNKEGKKVFQIGERNISPGEKIDLSKKHSFKQITTRTYYKGLHKIVLVINGNEILTKEFTLY